MSSLTRALQAEEEVARLDARLRDSEQARLLQAAAIAALKARLGECVEVLTRCRLRFEAEIRFDEFIPESPETLVAACGAAAAQARKLLEGNDGRT